MAENATAANPGNVKSSLSPKKEPYSFGKGDALPNSVGDKSKNQSLRKSLEPKNTQSNQ